MTAGDEQDITPAERQRALADHRADIAKASPLVERTVAEIEEGARDPTIAELLLLTRHALDVTWEKLIEHKTEIVQLRDELTQLQRTQKSGAIYAGTWSDARVFRNGDVVTCASALWIARRESHGVRPGGTDGSWQLILKSPGR